MRDLVVDGEDNDLVERIHMSIDPSCTTVVSVTAVTNYDSTYQSEYDIRNYPEAEMKNENEKER